MEIKLERLDRPSIRSLAEKHSAELRYVAQSGGNVYQSSLDQQDRIAEFSRTLSEDDLAKFLTMYSEELNACSSKTDDETAAALAEAETSNRIATAIGSVLGFALIVVVVLMVVS